MNLNTAGWASAAQRFIARLRSDGLNSTTPVTEINGGNISATNADIALVAKGNGATLAQVPDGTVAGGNKRGQYATDWQKSRNTAANIASGSTSTISGGSVNTASGSQSTVGGGFGNTSSGTTATIAGGNNGSASGTYAFVGGGDTNNVSGFAATACGGSGNNVSSNYSFVGGGQSNTAQNNTYAAVCGGISNTASGQYSFIGGGTSNTASGSIGVVAGGNANSATGALSSVLGGESNTANSDYSTVLGGRYGTTRGVIGYVSVPACNIPVGSATGTAQTGLLVLGRITATGSPAILRSNSSSTIDTTNQVILPNNSAYSFSGEVIAGVTGGGDTARWTINGAIKRGANAASTAMVGTVTVTMTHNDAGAATWSVAVTADTTNGGIAVTVTGAAATTIRWVCRMNTVEVTY